MSQKPAFEVLARCAAAARRAELPPATLRMWERRYGVIGPKRSPAGQRLYTEQDVQRLKVLKRVVDRGYAIGTVARLPTERLEVLAQAIDVSVAREGAAPLLRWAIVGTSLQERLAPLTFVMRNHLRFDDLTDALAKLEPGAADVIMLHSPSLREETSVLILKMLTQHPQASVAVVYSFGVATAVSKLRDAGVRLLRDPLTRAGLHQEVDQIARAFPQAGQHAQNYKSQRVPRLFNDSTLSKIEQHAAAIACECPAHLTSLISQLSAFETYSDECESPDSKDSALHRHIGDVASHTRSLLESLLQQVAAHEGLPVDFDIVPASNNSNHR